MMNGVNRSDALVDTGAHCPFEHDVRSLAVIRRAEGAPHLLR